MLKNYFKIAFRNLVKNKTFSLVNILGLTLGFACFILVSLFVFDELSFDRFHDDTQDIYRVVQNITEPSGDFRKVANVAPAIGSESKERFPEVADQTQLIHIGRLTVGNDPLNRGYEEIWITEPNFFEFFDFEFIYGDPATALVGPDKLVITESVAEQYFGRKDVLGESMYTNRFDATISGVIKDAPTNSHLNIRTFHTKETWADIFEDLEPWYETDWTSNSAVTYLKMSPGFDQAGFEGNLTELVTSNYSDEIEFSSEFWLQPLTDVHLYSNDINESINVNAGTPLYLYMFTIVGVLILVIACFNYMNLSTAAASRRTREVGMRKTLGAGKGQLIIQYLGESVLISTLSLLLAITAVELALPFINSISGKELFIPFNSPLVIISLLFIVLAAGILSALYPAFFLSRVNPAAAFKSEVKLGRSSFSLRKVLVVAQFAISIGMIATTIIIYQQLNFIRDTELGVNVNDRLTIDINSGALRWQFESIKDEMEKLPEVNSVTVSSRVPGEWKVFPTANVENLDSDETSQMIYIGADEDFLTTYDLELLDGRMLRNGSADSLSVVITEQGAKDLGLANPVGSTININGTIWNGDFDEEDGYVATVVGVVENFYFESLHETQKPVMIGWWYNPIHGIDYYTLDITTADWQETLAKLEAINHQFDPNNPVEHTFLDSRFEEIYRADQLRGKLFLIFSGIIIFISCMGLFALASFTIETRIREIGVRKVLGASVQNIIVLVCKDFMALVVIGFIIATPVAWYAVDKWLADFAYRIDLNPLFFAGAGATAFLIALLTISYQAVKAAALNPVESLRNE